MVYVIKPFAVICYCTALMLTTQLTLAQSNDVPTVEQILTGNPDPFADVNLQEILDNYGPDGSGIMLMLGGVPLVLTNNNLISNSESISGATGIIGDPSGFGFSIGLSGDYLFAFDKFELTDQATTSLASVLELYIRHDGKSIIVEGHTDSKGTEVYNQTLSERRAQAVVLWFSQNGIIQENLSSIGMGELHPIAENSIDGHDNPDGRAQNRRVEIRVVTRKKVNSLPIISSPVQNE